MTDTLGHVTLHEYDAVGNTVVTTDTLDRATRTAYDALNRPVTVTANYVDGVYSSASPDEDVTTLRLYDGLGRVSQRVQLSGTQRYTTTYAYDAAGRLIATTNALDGTTVNAYDDLGRRVAVTDAEGRTTRYAYDSAGRLITTTNALDGASVIHYDALGRRVEHVDAAGQVTQYGYDGAGRLISSTLNVSPTVGANHDDVWNVATRYSYDPLGRRTVVTDALGTATRYEYDDLNRLTAVVENYTGGSQTAEQDVRTEYGYDGLGNRLSVEDARGNVARTGHDGLGRLLWERDPLTDTVWHAYDGVGNRTTMTVTDPSATVVSTATYEYDDLNRLTAAEYVDGRVSYAYDSLGHRVAMTDSSGTTSWRYDTLYRPLTITAETSGTVGYRYDALGNRTRLLYPDNDVVTYTYDAANRLTGVDDWDGGETAYAYDGAGRLMTVTLPNGVVSSYTHDDAGRLTDLTHVASGETLAHYAYGLDALGNRVALTETLAQPADSGDQAALLGEARAFFAALPPAATADGILSATLERGPGVAAPATQSEDPPPGEWLDQVQEDIADSEYFITWQDETVLPDLAGAYHAPNRAHDLRTYFTPSGIRVVRRSTDEPAWQLGLALDSYGYGTNVQAASSEVQLTPERERITYQRTSPPGWDVTEWFVNDRRGLEHGFTIAEALGASKPRGDEEMHLFLELAVTGDLDFALDAAIPCTPVHPIAPPVPLADTARDELLPVVDCEPIEGLELTGDAVTAGDAVDFTTAGGVRVLRYSGLVVRDATGRELEAWFEVQEAALRIVLDARGAVYPISVDPMLTTPDWTGESDQASAYFGYSVGTAGDVNGDGYDDVIVGAYAYDNGQSDEGRAYVYTGTASGLSTTADWTTESDQADARLGISVGTAGDVNGDGYDDVIVGAPRYDDGQSNEGSSYVYTGTASGLGSTADWTGELDKGWAELGRSVGTAGDVNNDGYDDVIVGAPYYDDEGRTYVFTGTAAGLSTTPDVTLVSSQDYCRFGYSVGTAGDVNGDNYDDVIVGAPRYDNGQSDEGRSYVYTGTAAGLSTTAAWTGHVGGLGGGCEQRRLRRRDCGGLLLRQRADERGRGLHLHRDAGRAEHDGGVDGRERPSIGAVWLFGGDGG